MARNTSTDNNARRTDARALIAHSTTASSRQTQFTRVCHKCAAQKTMRSTLTHTCGQFDASAAPYRQSVLAEVFSTAVAEWAQ